MASWQYADDATSHHGLMRCCSCGNPIKGPYRVREKNDAYVTQHRACSEFDPQWAVMDRQAEKRQRKAEQLRSDCLALMRQGYTAEELADEFREIAYGKEHETYEG
jgi:hypothetical protein